jgi:hypothetical protein
VSRFSGLASAAVICRFRDAVWESSLILWEGRREERDAGGAAGTRLTQPGPGEYVD